MRMEGLGGQIIPNSEAAILSVFGSISLVPKI
jgi:hypothetical protein